MVKGMIFDLDGTTVDTIGDIALALNSALGTSFSNETCNSFVGNGLRNAMQAAYKALGRGAEYSAAHFEEDYARFLENYYACPVKYSHPYPGVADFLRGLKARGVKIGIFSNKEHALLLQVVDAVFPGLEFDFVQGRGGKYAPKPAPDAVLAFVELCGASRDEILYVGDSEVDYKCASEAAVPCLILSWGSRSRAALVDSGVPTECIIEKIDDVSERIR